MSFNYNGDEVVSGSFGKVYMDGREIAEIEEFEMKGKFETKDIKLYGGETGTKNTGIKNEIKLKIKKVFSYELDLLKNIKNGKLNTFCTLNVQIDDPEALGAEAIAINNAKFTGDIDFLSFKRGELIDREFTLSALTKNIEILESIELI